MTKEMTLINRKSWGGGAASKAAKVVRLKLFKWDAMLDEKEGIWSADVGWSDVAQPTSADEAGM